MKNFKVVTLTLLLFGMAASPAMAEGYYAALDAGQSKAKDACTGVPGGWTGCSDTGTMVRIAGGYQFTPMWGAEISYADLGSASLGSGIISSIAVSGNYKASSVQLSGTGTFPVTDAFSIIAKLGIASTDLTVTASGGGVSVDQSATTTKAAFGIGAQYDFTKNISVRAQYEDLGDVGDSNTTGTSNVTLLSAGLVYKF
ncbi:MAG: outer membrane beta-barrel protein [Gallionella sp.]